MDNFSRDGYGRPLRSAPAGPPPPRPLQGAANLTFELVAELQAVGVDSLDRLADIGAREAFLRLRQQFRKRDRLASLLALQGAIEDEVVTFLPLEKVDQLRAWLAEHQRDEA